YESYLGINVKLWFVALDVLGYRQILHPRKGYLHSFRMPPDSNNLIKMEGWH
ncbi:hypothetical protein EDB83DRAFT_2461747, partial [Lactarius deliciosus]